MEEGASSVSAQANELPLDEIRPAASSSTAVSPPALRPHNFHHEMLQKFPDQGITRDSISQFQSHFAPQQLFGPIPGSSPVPASGSWQGSGQLKMRLRSVAPTIPASAQPTLPFPVDRSKISPPGRYTISSQDIDQLKMKLRSVSSTIPTSLGQTVQIQRSLGSTAMTSPGKVVEKGLRA